MATSSIVESLKWIIGADSTEFRAEFERARKGAKGSMDEIGCRTAR